MNPILEIFSQGEEIVTGQTADTNAAWLSQQTVQMGFTVTRHTAVGDNLNELIVLLREIALRADCCICTGGLGPTSDDLTAEAVAKAFGLELEFDEIAFAQIKRFFDNRNRPMPETNRKQAMLPAGAARIDNEWGTAPGFSLLYGRCWFAFLPGVPYEMRHLFLERVRPALADRFALLPGRLITIRTVGIGESDIQQRIAAITIPDQVQLGFRAGIDDVQTKLLFPYGYSETEMASLVSNIAEQLGNAVFGIDGLAEASGDLVTVIDRLMQAGGRTLTAIETASQGLLAAKCIGMPWLLGALFDRSLDSLGQRFAVPADRDDLMATAEKIAVAARKSAGADFALVQLYAGDDDIFHDKDRPIVLYNVLLTADGFHQSIQTVAGPIRRKQNQAALLALDLLRRNLQHQEI
ncbi:competence/damage-inducible protein A [Methylobacter sp. YRD-M1]|uniref:competence/damage-inducible protein A n=1 Tax=Methylobacter sp. YRD-M1 TaxID=2911520 RepID=UPI00227B0C8E|nr:molybdopterin-binding protein [Methylobacter sp. YRD-M1]WAK02926.1 molybdopterin-binding protein [Methylobacter sp. YRD-M1]